MFVLKLYTRQSDSLRLPKKVSLLILVVNVAVRKICAICCYTFKFENIAQAQMQKVHINGRCIDNTMRFIAEPITADSRSNRRIS